MVTANGDNGDKRCFFFSILGLCPRRTTMDRPFGFWLPTPSARFPQKVFFELPNHCGLHPQSRRRQGFRTSLNPAFYSQPQRYSMEQVLLNSETEHEEDQVAAIEYLEACKSISWLPVISTPRSNRSLTSSALGFGWTKNYARPSRGGTMRRCRKSSLRCAEASAAYSVSYFTTSRFSVPTTSPKVQDFARICLVERGELPHFGRRRDAVVLPADRQGGNIDFTSRAVISGR